MFKFLFIKKSYLKSTPGQYRNFQIKGEKGLLSVQFKEIGVSVSLPTYLGISVKFIPKYFHVGSSVFKFSQIVNSEKSNISIHLYKFINIEGLRGNLVLFHQPVPFTNQY